MSTIKIKSVAILAISLSLTFGAVARATPAQKQRIVALTKQVHRQQAVIVQRNAAIATLTQQRNACQAATGQAITTQYASLSPDARFDLIGQLYAGFVDQRVGEWHYYPEGSNFMGTSYFRWTYSFTKDNL